MTAPGEVRPPLKVAVLTTKTPHHLYFLRELRRRCSSVMSLDLVVIEARAFPTSRFFWRFLASHWYNPFQGLLLNPYLKIPYKAREQLHYELEHFFADSDYGYDTDLRVEQVRSVNNARAHRLLLDVAPDIVLVYGTGLVRPHVFNIARIASINCHGGWLPGYRGSDTNLWAAFRGEFDRMALAWHDVDSTFDTGPVYMMERVEPRPDMSVVTLRYYTTLLATDMCARLLRLISEGGIEARPQAKGGRYYRPMPWLFKPLADWRLRRFARRSFRQDVT